MTKPEIRMEPFDYPLPFQPDTIQFSLRGYTAVFFVQLSIVEAVLASIRAGNLPVHLARATGLSVKLRQKLHARAASAKSSALRDSPR
jgi:hypothetical protein